MSIISRHSVHGKMTYKYYKLQDDLYITSRVCIVHLP